MPWLWAATGAASKTGAAVAAAGAEQHRARVLGRARRQAPRAVVEPVEPGRQFGAERGQIGLADDEGVGEGHLPRRLGKAVDVARPRDRIDQGDDPSQMQAVVEHRIGAQGVEDRRRVGEAGGFDDDAAKGADVAVRTPVEQAAQGAGEILANRAAQAPAGQLDDAALYEVDEMMVDRDFADLVDDDGGVGERRRRQRAAQQRGFAAAEKTGQHRCRQCFGFGHPC